MLDLEQIRDYCLNKKLTEEAMPFGDGVLVFKVAGKMFLLVSLDSDPMTINAKCDPEKAIELREEYSSITPGYHMNKKMWNTISIDGSIPFTKIYELINHSYLEVVKGMSKKLQDQLV
jgi:predicted DNA-binding protein (MmcQ/YjbR family)